MTPTTLTFGHWLLRNDLFSVTKGVIAFTAILAFSTPTKATEFDLLTASVVDINHAFDAGALTAERLAELCIARIQAFDQQGPRINAVINIHPQALELARELDLERRTTGPRSPIHGIPVLLKDNYDTFDMPTTGASIGLTNSMAPDDAFTVRRLREAGALILAKVNLSELARSGVSISSLMGQTLNPYDLTRTPGGSSGGTGAAIGATFGILGTGSDTGQSTRSPSSANNSVGIRPTFGLISRDGIIPISYTQDTAGPITRYVADAAVMMDYLVGFDAADPSTWSGIARAPKSYTAFLDSNALQGARIGVVEDAFGHEPIHQEVTTRVLAEAEVLRGLGATVFPVRIPEVSHYFANLSDISVGNFESAHFMNEYFASLGPKSRFKNLWEFVQNGQVHPPILERLKQDLEIPNALQHPDYLIRLQRQAVFREALVAVMDRYQLDALFYPHQRRLVVPTGPEPPNQIDRNGFMASTTGLPAITFPGGFSAPTADAPIGVPIGIEFLGRPFSEGRLISLAYAHEQHTRYRKTPVSTPALPGEKITY
jgi:Asp-tRNA(Asn)/Glu-tRNA(Gln) amidotransferase A subunit family amidase